MNSCGQEVVHYTIAFTLGMITSGPLEALWVVRGWGVCVCVKGAGNNRDSGRPGRGPCLRVYFFSSSSFLFFYIAYLMCLRWATAPLGFMKMIADAFRRSTVPNGHLSVWSTSTESHCAALQEVQGGSCYLTCTVDGLQLTERCHFQRGRPAFNCKHKDVSQRKSRLFFWSHERSDMSGLASWDSCSHLCSDDAVQRPCNRNFLPQVLYKYKS